MAKEYEQDWNKVFPLAKFAEAVYQMRLKDVTAIDAATFSQEIQSLAGDRFKMVIRRQWQPKGDEPQEEWTFRHDTIAEFFIAQTFLGESEMAQQRIEQHISDPRFRGVYFLLATAMPAAIGSTRCLSLDMGEQKALKSLTFELLDFCDR
jgi:hypothetical protein